MLHKKQISNGSLRILVIIFHVKANYEKKQGIIYMLLWSAIATYPFIFWGREKEIIDVTKLQISELLCCQRQRIFSGCERL